MAPLPKPQSATVTAIYAAYEAAAEYWDSLGISVGEANTPCDRQLWYSFRWCTPLEVHSGRQLRLFATGNLEEERLVADLERIGVDVYGQQDRIRLVQGHVRGKADGKAMGIPEAPKTEHLVEFKSSKNDKFQELKKKGVKAAKPDHYATFQFYMWGLGLTRVLYMCSGKDDEDLHLERVEYDAEFAIRAVARIERIINSPTPPTRLCSKRDDFRGMFCRQAAVCWGEVKPRVHCRSCIHATPLMDGNAGWDCARWSKPISLAEQDEGCPAHLFIPEMLVGYEQVDCSEEEEWVEYRMPDGTLWRDGARDQQ